MASEARWQKSAFWRIPLWIAGVRVIPQSHGCVNTPSHAPIQHESRDTTPRVPLLQRSPVPSEAMNTQYHASSESDTRRKAWKGVHGLRLQVLQ